MEENVLEVLLHVQELALTGAVLKVSLICIKRLGHIFLVRILSTHLHNWGVYE